MERDRRILRLFGLALAVFLAAIVGGVLPGLGLFPFQPWLWTVAGAVAALAAAAPRLLAPVHWAWLKVGGVLGWINSRLLLGIVFFGVVWPIGLVRRLTGDPVIAKGWDRNAPTYRSASTRRDPSQFERPY